MKLGRLISEGEKSDKMSQKEAGYMIPKEGQNKRSGLFCCFECNNFMPPHGCKGVAGMIYAGGCCNHYESDKAKST